MNHIPETSLPLLENLDIAVLDALRHTPHPSHSTLSESIEWANRLAPRTTYFTHMSHEILHAETETSLPDNMRLAYDGLQIHFEI